MNLLVGIWNFTNYILHIDDLKEENGIISLNLYNEMYDCYFYLEFVCEKYNWYVCDIIPVDDYYKYSDNLKEHVEDIIKIQGINIPVWSIFED